jgi:Major royal jelly protein
VSTKYLRDKAEAMDEKNHDKFQYLGKRGRGRQASASFVDEKSGVLFYTQVGLVL